MFAVLLVAHVPSAEKLWERLVAKPVSEADMEHNGQVVLDTLESLALKYPLEPVRGSIQGPPPLGHRALARSRCRELHAYRVLALDNVRPRALPPSPPFGGVGP